MPTKLLTLLFLVSLSISSQAQKTTVKIMSYNIKHGEGNDGVMDLSRSAAVIKAQTPDLCGLQEIDHYCGRSGKIDQTSYLAEATSMKGTFGKFMDFDGGKYGMATLSAKPLISSKVLQLPDGSDEPRSSIVHEVAIAEGCIIAFANVHFDYIKDSPFRLAQAKALVMYLDQLKRPSIITGDFNCTPDSPTMQYFAEQGFVFAKKGKDNLSFQLNTKMEIDHVIYRNTDLVKFKVKGIELLNEPIVSDHRPLVAVLKVKY